MLLGSTSPCSSGTTTSLVCSQLTNMIDYLISELIYATRKHLASPTAFSIPAELRISTPKALSHQGCSGKPSARPQKPQVLTMIGRQKRICLSVLVVPFVSYPTRASFMSGAAELEMASELFALGGRWLRLILNSTFIKFIPKPQTPFSTGSLMFYTPNSYLFQCYFYSMH